MRVVVGLILLGLPVAIAVSWLFDFTPSGFKRDDGVPASTTRAAETPPAHQSSICRPPPAPATPLVGREAEIAEVVERIGSDARVVTITGPGGTGKTRLAIAAANRLRHSFPSGMAYVELAAVADSDAVVPTIAIALGVKEADTRSLAEGLSTIIGDRVRRLSRHWRPARGSPDSRRVRMDGARH